MNLSPTVRWLLGGVAAVVAYLAASDPFGFSDEVQGIVACLAVLFGSLGIVPPQVGGTQQGVVNPSITEPPAADIRERELGLTTVELIGILCLIGIAVLIAALVV